MTNQLALLTPFTRFSVLLLFFSDSGKTKTTTTTFVGNLATERLIQIHAQSAITQLVCSFVRSFVGSPHLEWEVICCVFFISWKKHAAIQTQTRCCRVRRRRRAIISHNIAHLCSWFFLVSKLISHSYHYIIIISFVHVRFVCASALIKDTTSHQSHHCI